MSPKKKKKHRVPLGDFISCFPCFLLGGRQRGLGRSCLHALCAVTALQGLGPRSSSKATILSHKHAALDFLTQKGGVGKSQLRVDLSLVAL